MSVGNYLFAGELTEKTHFMSRETHSTDQGEMRNYVQGSNDPLNSLTWEGMQPKSKVTRHQSVATPSQRIKRIHKDLRAYQSYQTNLRQALNHIYDMGGPLNSLPTKNRAKRAQPTVGRPARSADQVVMAHRPHRLTNDTWQGAIGLPWCFGSILGQMAGGSPLISSLPLLVDVYA